MKITYFNYFIRLISINIFCTADRTHALKTRCCHATSLVLNQNIILKQMTELHALRLYLIKHPPAPMQPNYFSNYNTMIVTMTTLSSLMEAKRLVISVILSWLVAI